MVSTSHGFSLMINLSNYVENGIYRIMTNVTWLRFLHCNNGLGSSNVTDQTYDVNPMDLSITGLVPNSKYNITVVVGNALGRKTKSVLNETRAAGTVIKPSIIYVCFCIIVHCTTTHNSFFSSICSSKRNQTERKVFNKYYYHVESSTL